MFDNYEVQTIEAYKISRSKQGLLGNVSTETKEFEFPGYIDYLSGLKILKGGKYEEDTTHILMTNSLTSTQAEKLSGLEKYELKENGKRYRILDVDDLTKIGSSNVQHYEIQLQYVKADQTKR